MRSIFPLIALAFFTLLCAACTEEMRIEGLDQTSLEYKCFASHGTYIGGRCECNGTPCALGSICDQTKGEPRCYTTQDEENAADKDAQ